MLTAPDAMGFVNARARLVVTLLRNHAREIVNIAWLVGDRAFRVLGTFLIGLVIARIMGPEDFGGFSYAYTLITLLMLAVSLGLNGVVVKQVVDRPHDAGEILGTACLLQAAAAAAVVAVLALMPALTGWTGDHYARLALIMALGLLFRPSEPVRYWFESQVSAKYAVMADNAAFVVGAAMKLGSLWMWRSLTALAWATAAEMALSGIFLVLIYRRHAGHGVQWRLTGRTARTLLGAGWPLLLAGLSIALYTRIDQVILMALRGPVETGIFSAAARIGEMLYVLPTVVATTFFPRWQRLLQQSKRAHACAIATTMTWMVGSCALLSLAMLPLAPLVTHLLYGDGYATAAPALAIHIWTCVFVGMGVLGNQWYLSHGLQSRTLFCTVLGAATNIGLNFILVPAMGATGAAIASVAAQAVSAFLADAASPASRPLFRLKARVLLFPVFWIADIRKYRRR